MASKHDRFSTRVRENTFDVKTAFSGLKSENAKTRWHGKSQKVNNPVRPKAKTNANQAAKQGPLCDPDANNLQKGKADRTDDKEQVGKPRQRITGKTDTEGRTKGASAGIKA